MVSKIGEAVLEAFRRGSFNSSSQLGVTAMGKGTVFVKLFLNNYTTVGHASYTE